MRFIPLSLALTAGLLSAIIGANAETIRSKVVTLSQSGNTAREHDPDCATGSEFNASDALDKLLKLGAEALDKYIGQPIASNVVDNLPHEAKDWFAVRMGIHNGKSTCETLCLLVPQEQFVRACVTKDFGSHDSSVLHHPSGSGRYCYTDKATLDAIGKGYHDLAPNTYAATDASIKTFTIARTGRAKLVCATGANWSAGESRMFWLETF